MGTVRDSMLGAIERELSAQWMRRVTDAQVAASSVGIIMPSPEPPDFRAQAAQMLDDEVQRMAGGAVMSRLFRTGEIGGLRFGAAAQPPRDSRVDAETVPVATSWTLPERVTFDGVNFVDVNHAPEAVIDRRVHDDHEAHACVQGGFERRRHPVVTLGEYHVRDPLPPDADFGPGDKQDS